MRENCKLLLLLLIIKNIKIYIHTYIYMCVHICILPKVNWSKTKKNNKNVSLKIKKIKEKNIFKTTTKIYNKLFLFHFGFQLNWQHFLVV